MTSRPVRAHLGREQAAGAGGWWEGVPLEASLLVPRARQADPQQAGTVCAFVWFRKKTPSFPPSKIPSFPSQ